MSARVPHGPVTRHGAGPWDYLTRGFWEGGRRVTAGELRPGDVYREGCLTGYVVVDVRPAPASWPDPSRPCVDVVTTSGVRPYLAAGELELLTRN